MNAAQALLIWPDRMSLVRDVVERRRRFILARMAFPTRLVISDVMAMILTPPDAPWDRSPDGRPRFEVKDGSMLFGMHVEVRDVDLPEVLGSEDP